MFALPAGGGGVAAVAMARWEGASVMYTALGDDELGHRAEAGLRARGVDVRCAWRRSAQRRAITMVDRQRERTIVVIGERHVAHEADALAWQPLDGIYITGGDAGAIRRAREHAKVVVGTARILPALQAAGVALDALVSSANDPAERYSAGELAPEPALVVKTDGSHGGTFVVGGAAHHYAATPTTVTGDTYGAGDTFAAGLTYALARGLPPAEAVADAARRATEVLAWRGPYPPPV